jgi:hypothetical protein
MYSASCNAIFAAMVSPYPPELVFMIQFSGEADPGRGPLTGRLEHIESGRSCLFTSWQEVDAFVMQVLRSESVASDLSTPQVCGSN